MTDSVSDTKLHPSATPFGTGWAWVLAYGILVVLIGLLALANPAATGLATGVLLGLVLLLYGGAAIAAGLSPLSGRARWIEIALGVLALAAGVATLINPFAGALSLIWVVGAWLLVAGIFEVIGGLRAAHDRGWRLLLGVVDIALGAIPMFSSPASGLVFLAVLVGISFIMRGIFLTVLAFSLRRLKQAP
jgi:Uncharacterized conserved protein